jgi:hypothetical protein
MTKFVLLYKLGILGMIITMGDMSRKFVTNL